MGIVAATSEQQEELEAGCAERRSEPRADI